MKVATRRLLEEQTAVDVVLGSGEKSDAMWHVPQCDCDDIEYGVMPRPSIVEGLGYTRSYGSRCVLCSFNILTNHIVKILQNILQNTLQ